MDGRNELKIIKYYSSWMIAIFFLFPITAQAATTVSGIKIVTTTPAYNSSNKTYESLVTLTNTKKIPIASPLAILVSSISRRDVSLVEPSGSYQNKPFQVIPLPSGVIAPRQTIGNIVLRFNSLKRKQFSFSKSVITGIVSAKSKPLNRIPIANAGQDQTISVGAQAQLNGVGSTDADGNSLSYQWAITLKPVNSNVTLLNADQLQPTFIVDQPGQYKVQLVVNDGKLDSFPDTVLIDTVNATPFANAGFPIKPKKGNTVTLNGSLSSDWNNDPLNFEWSLLTKPTGSKAKLLNLKTAGPVFKVDKLGDYTARLRVNDGFNKSDPAVVTVSTVNSLPVANAGADQLHQLVGQPVSLSGKASFDADGESLTSYWTLLTKPVGSNAQLTSPYTFDTQFTPDMAGDYVAQLMVNDGNYNSDPDTVLIATSGVLENNILPHITSSPITTASVGNIYSYDIEATDSVGDTLTYAINQSPTGMSIDVLTGLISWIPSIDQTGDQTVLVSVADNKGGSDSQSFNINVSSTSNQPNNQTPHFSGTPTLNATIGQVYTYDANATDSDSDTLIYSLTQSPIGMSINSQTGLISWSPSTVQIGVNPISIAVTDSKGGIDNQSFNINVTANNQMVTPNLVNQTRSAAESAIQQAKLILGTVSSEYNDLPEGTVISQSPAANSAITIGTTINLTVSLGPEPIQGPINLDDLQITPLLIPTSSPVPVTVSVKITDSAYVPGSAALNRLNENDEPIAVLGTFHDDGLDGDDTAADLTYTTRVTLQESKEGRITLGATADFGKSSHSVKSLPSNIIVKTNVSLADARAVVNNERIVFKNLQGQKITEIPLIYDTQSRQESSSTSITVTEESAIGSLDQRYVGILKTQIAGLVIPGDESENQTLINQEFRYVDATGTLWAKTPTDVSRSFYIPEYSPVISSDGQRIILIEVNEGNNNPDLFVYNAAGSSILHQQVDLSTITDTQLSTNGRYLLLRGDPKDQPRDKTTVIIIDIENPINSWTGSFNGSTAESEQYTENASGGFDVVINDIKLISFPN